MIVQNQFPFGGEPKNKNTGYIIVCAFICLAIVSSSYFKKPTIKLNSNDSE